jgi:hypothetical protein
MVRARRADDWVRGHFVEIIEADTLRRGLGRSKAIEACDQEAISAAKELHLLMRRDCNMYFIYRTMSFNSA